MRDNPSNRSEQGKPEYPEAQAYQKANSDESAEEGELKG